MTPLGFIALTRHSGRTIHIDLERVGAYGDGWLLVQGFRNLIRVREGVEEIAAEVVRAVKDMYGAGYA